MKSWTKLTQEEKLTILANVAENKGIVPKFRSTSV